MDYLRLQSFFLVLLVSHRSLCQQQSSYSPQSQTKVQLEDIERDNLKSAQPQTAAPPTQGQQFYPYPSQDQFIYNLPPQQPYPLIQAAQPPAAGQLYQVPPQQAALFSPQQQQLLYYTQAQQPLIDFSAFPYYQAGAGAYPYVVPQPAAQANALSPNAAAAAEYYKSLQASQPKGSAPAGPTPLVKTLQAQIPSNYLLQQPIYQPLPLPQPQNPQYYAYNSFYQLQAPSKSLLAAGVKSTTPASAIKGGKDEQFVPIGGSNYRIEYPAQDQLTGFNKARLSG